LASLERRSPLPELVRMREADDHLALAALMRDAEAMALAAHPAGIRQLWEACQIPDFRKTLGDSHVRLVGQIFRFLRGPAGKLPTDWVARQVARLDNVEGDIDTLLARIAHVRTWTYVSHRPSWLDDAAHWQERTRAVEDKLSDVLHERLMQRFVDRRAAALSRRLKSGAELMAAVTDAGEVLIEGEVAGQLEGFKFVADADLGESGRALLAAANRALRRDIDGRVRKLATAGAEEFAVDAAGTLRWRGQAVARLATGDDALTPQVVPLPGDLLEPRHREAVRQRLAAWFADHAARVLQPLARLREAELKGPGRGLAFELVRGLGTVPRARVAEQAAALSKADRATLRALGVVIGETAVFVPSLKRSDAVALRALLWSVFAGQGAVPPPSGSRLSFKPAPEIPMAGYAACGYLPAGRLMVRADRLEKLARTARDLAHQGPFAATPALGLMVGARPDDLADILGALGYRAAVDDAGLRFVRRAAGRRRGRRDGPERGTMPHSPFAELRRLVST
jgi:ATP-dependent RNA helicase SUPV3L1/SUV3